MKKGVSPTGGEHYYFGTENKLRIFPPNTYKFKPRDHIVLDGVQECVLDNFWFQYNNKREDRGYMLAILNSLAEYFNMINGKIQPEELPTNIEKRPIYVIYKGTKPGVYVTYEAIVVQQMEMEREGKGKPSWKKYLDIDEALLYARSILGINYFLEPAAKEYIQHYKKTKNVKINVPGINMHEASSSKTPTYKDAVKKDISIEDIIEKRMKERFDSIIPQLKKNIKEEVLQEAKQEINEIFQSVSQDFENIKKDYEEYIKKDYDLKMNAQISEEDINDMLDDNMMDVRGHGQPLE